MVSFMTFILVALFIASMTELLSGKVPCFLKRSLQFRAKLPLAFHSHSYSVNAFTVSSSP